jgi:hypothetical protein
VRNVDEPATSNASWRRAHSIAIQTHACRACGSSRHRTVAAAAREPELRDQDPILDEVQRHDACGWAKKHAIINGYRALAVARRLA